MSTARRQRFVLGQAAWMLGTLVALVALSALSLDLYFVVSLLGFLVVVELTAPLNLTPRWRRRLKWVVLAGLVVFGYIVGRRVFEILSSRLL